MRKQPLIAFVLLVGWIVFMFVDAIVYRNNYQVHYTAEEPQIDFSVIEKEIKTNIESSS